MNTHAVVCNEVDGTPSVTPGALCFVRQYSTATGSVLVDVMNREGRWITLWRPYSSLKNFRTKFITPNHVKAIWARPDSASRAKVAALIQAFTKPAAESEEAAAEPDVEI
ncbi:hypothetical protein [Fimbriimonas ginsengisoli]|uniref:hypothetical protein n=1 Tax=Fimbriimonas ginsengisoli TaxID=1005039 RepID=UPI001186F132|nr:hypothetical protein [Fimbriimonas ginsengisoli]